MNYHRQSRPRLLRNRRLFQQALEHKEAVTARHAPGTAYHTRATLEAETLRGRIVAIDAELEKRRIK